MPGLWVPALLYEPEKLTGKVPVSLAVNGHDGLWELDSFIAPPEPFGAPSLPLR